MDIIRHKKKKEIPEEYLEKVTMRVREKLNDPVKMEGKTIRFYVDQE